MESLIGLKHLKSLSLGFNVMPHLINRPYRTVPVQQESQEVLQLAQMCTSLELVRILPEEGSIFDYKTRFYISRASNGVVTRVHRWTMRVLEPYGGTPLIDLDSCAQKYRQLLNDSTQVI
jgi:hypothetical protein